MHSFKQYRLFTLLAMVLVLLLAACTAPATTPGSAEEAPEGEETNAEEAGEVMLEMWMGGEPDTVNAMTELIDEYQELNPDVTIDASFVGSDLFNPTLLPALNAGTGPDIFGFGIGPGQPAAVIEAGHVLDLTPYYCDYGWDEVIPDQFVNQTSSEGKLWAVGDSVEHTQVFYNKEIFEEHGLSVPATWEEFIDLSLELKDAGYETPIALGGADRWPISHWQTVLWGRYAGPEGVDEVMYGDGAWDEEHFVEATRRLAEMNEAGLFGSSPLAIAYDDIMPQFWRGDIPMTFTGSWVVSDAVSDLGEEVENFSVFQLPPIEPDQEVYPTEGIGTGWYVNSDTEHPDVAADLLDFLFFRPESRAQLLQTGTSVPVGPIDLESIELPTLSEEIFALADQYRDNGTIPAFFDTWQPANVTNVTYDGLQAILADQMTAEEFNAAVQEAWEEAEAAGDTLARGTDITCS